MVHWWGWLELGRGPQARQDNEGEVVLDVCGRVCLHWNWQVLPVHEGGGVVLVVRAGRDVPWMDRRRIRGQDRATRASRYLQA
jgi:hypothetical protein